MWLWKEFYSTFTILLRNVSTPLLSRRHLASSVVIIGQNFGWETLVSTIRVYGSKHVRLLSVPHCFHRSWPQDDLGAVERTRTIASGEAAGNDPSSSKCAFRALIWRETQNEQGEVSNDSILEYRWEVLIRIWIFFAPTYSPTLEDSDPSQTCCLLSSSSSLIRFFRYLFIDGRYARLPRRRHLLCCRAS